MAVPSVSCTYSWPVWTEEHTVGAPAALTHTYLLYACGPRASAWPPFLPCWPSWRHGCQPADHLLGCGLSSSPAAAAVLHSPYCSGQLQPRGCCCKLSGRFIKFITVPDFLMRGISAGSPRHTVACLEVAGSRDCRTPGPVQPPSVASRGQQSARHEARGCLVSLTWGNGTGEAIDVTSPPIVLG